MIERELMLITLKRRMYEALAEINVNASNPTEVTHAIRAFELLLNKMGDRDAGGE